MGVDQFGRDALHRLQWQPGGIGPADAGDGARQQAAHDFDRLSGQRPRVASAGRAQVKPRLGGVSGARERLLNPSGAARETGERRRIQPLRGQRLGQPAQTRASEARVFVGGIAGEGCAPRLAERNEFSLAKPEQGPCDLDLAAPASCRHAGKARQPRAARKAEQHGFGLIVEVMGGDDDAGADAAGFLRQQGVAGLARALL